MHSDARVSFSCSSFPAPYLLRQSCLTACLLLTANMVLLALKSTRVGILVLKRTQVIRGLRKFCKMQRIIPWFTISLTPTLLTSGWGTAKQGSEQGQGSGVIRTPFDCGNIYLAGEDRCLCSGDIVRAVLGAFGDASVHMSDCVEGFACHDLSGDNLPDDDDCTLAQLKALLDIGWMCGTDGTTTYVYNCVFNSMFLVTIVLMQPTFYSEEGGAFGQGTTTYVFNCVFNSIYLVTILLMQPAFYSEEGGAFGKGSTTYVFNCVFNSIFLVTILLMQPTFYSEEGGAFQGSQEHPTGYTDGT
jgi:preprotein translocase subunit SecG